MAVRLRGFRPSAEKVYHVDVHPTLPWIVSSDGDDKIVLWDWEHSQILYELNAGGVDQSRLVDAQLQRMADTAEDGVGSKGKAGAEAIRGGGVKDVKFYDEDVRFWSFWAARSAFSESPTVTAGGLGLPPIGGCPPAIRGRRFLFMCCENKAIILDLVTRRAKDLPKLLLENKAPLCVEFLPPSSTGDPGPFAAFGGPDGAIRVLSLSTWQFVKKLTGGHKGAVHCLLPFIAGNGEVILASGGADGSLVLWAAADGGTGPGVGPAGFMGREAPLALPQQQNSVQLQENGTAPPAVNVAPAVVLSSNPMREILPKVVIPKAHDGGVHVISLLRVPGSSPQLVTCGADKSVAVWDTMAFQELRRVKGAIPKMVCHSVAGWSHPRAPSVLSLACAKDSHIWALDGSGGSRPLCDLVSHVPPTPQIAAGKKLKVYCMVPHPLQPHLVVTGTNVGVVITSFDAAAVPPAVTLPHNALLPAPMPPPGQAKKADKDRGGRDQGGAGGGAAPGGGGGAPGEVEGDEPRNKVLFYSRHRLYSLSFEAVAAPPQPTAAAASDPTGATRSGAGAQDAAEPLMGPRVRQVRKLLHTMQGTSDTYCRVEMSKSGKYVSLLWPEVPLFQVLRLSDMAVLDSGAARLLAWDSCRDRYATLSGAAVPTVQRQVPAARRGLAGVFRSSKSQKEQREAEAVAAQAAAAAAAVMAVATVEVKSVAPDGTVVSLCSAINTNRKEPITSLHSGALLGVAYRMPKRASLSDEQPPSPSRASSAGPGATTAPPPGSGGSGSTTPQEPAPAGPAELSLLDMAVRGDAFLGAPPPSPKSPQAAATAAEAAGVRSSLADQMEQPANFQLFSWETFRPVSQLLPEPLWSLWDPVVEYCALVYEGDVVVASLRPQFRCLGRVAVKGATSGAWQRRQLFLATPTSVECVFVDAGVSAIDVETRRRKAARQRQEEEAAVVQEKGEMALLAMEPPKPEREERVQLRPPMLQVVRLASFASLPAVPPISAMVRVRLDLHASTAAAAAAAEAAAAAADDGRTEQGLLDGPDARPPEMAVGGGGVPTAVGPLPMEQRRPIGPISVVGVRDGVLWLVDRYASAYAVSLAHPGVRCRCLAAYGDPVGAVKWASRLGREHQDELAKFMVGMGYIKEALHLPGLSKRFEYELALQSGDLERALVCLKALSRPPKWSSATAAAAAYEGSAAAPPLPAVGGDVGLGLGLNLGLGMGMGSSGNTGGVGMVFDSTGILAMAESQANMMDAAAGVGVYARDFLTLIDAADATGQDSVARHALHLLAGAGLLDGALSVDDLRRLSLRLAGHGEGNRLQSLCASLVSLGLGREAADAAALMGDATLLEKVWQDTGCLPEAALHAQSHGRPTLKALLQQWNKALQKQEAALSASQLLQSAHFQTLFGNIEQRPDPWEALAPAAKAPPVEVVAPGDYSFQPEGAGALVPQAAGAGAPGGAGGPTTAMWSAAFMFPQAQGVQGLNQPLDLKLLEGAGKRGPAPQKAATVGVPVHFAAFQPKPKPLGLPAPEPAGAAGAPAANGQGPHAGAAPLQKPKAAAAQAPAIPAPAAGRAGGLVGPTMADFEWAAMEASHPPR